MKVYSFPRGGLSFSDSTVPPRNVSAVAFLPALSVIPLERSPGGTVNALVSVGDSVTEGMLVGTGKGLVNVHATVPGKVINRLEWEDREGKPTEALVIRMEGSFERLGRAEKNMLSGGISSKELRQALTECGIVEMEGSGKPVAETLSSFSKTGPHTLVVRCVFDDPWLAADYVLCKERLRDVVEGCFIIARAEKIKRVIFAVSHREWKIGEAMCAEAAHAETVQYGIPSTLVLTGSKYPQRNRRELELVLQNYGKKENVELGTLLILGPATLAAVYDAVKYRRPILDRYIAVGGSAVRKPQVMRARIGKRLGELFNECGGFIANPSRIALGSPLSGKTVATLNEPVSKTSFAVFAMLKAQAGDYLQRNCISCGECRNVCPVGLDPEERYKRISNLGDGAEQNCHGCGCCEVVCPSRLPLSDVIMGKKAEEQDA